MTKQLDLITRIATCHLSPHLARSLLISCVLLPFQAAPARAHDHLVEPAGQHREAHRAEPRPAPNAAHAVITGDDYPAAWKRPARDAFANISGFNRECVSFASWKIYVDSGGRQVPTGTNVPPDWLTFSINVDADWGNASSWSAFAAAHGVRMDNNPTPGSIAQWDKHPAIGMTVGHVGVVKAVNGDGSIEIEQYNLRENGMYSILHMPRNSSAVDRSNGRGPWAVPWPDHFIHIHGR